jgi:hypothetical protein
MDGMMVVFEVHVVPGADPGSILTAETLRETGAQVMTYDEATKVGIVGLPPPPADHVVRYVALAKRDAPWIYRSMESNDAVGGFNVHEVG